MNKGVIALVALSCLLTSACTFQTEKGLIESYISDIKTQLAIKSEEDYFYTYKKVEPQTNHAYIIDFYVFDIITDYTQWLCIKEGNQIDCDMLFVRHLS